MNSSVVSSSSSNSGEPSFKISTPRLLPLHVLGALNLQDLIDYGNNLNLDSKMLYEKYSDLIKSRGPHNNLSPKDQEKTDKLFTMLNNINSSRDDQQFMLFSRWTEQLEELNQKFKKGQTFDQLHQEFKALKTLFKDNPYQRSYLEDNGGNNGKIAAQTLQKEMDAFERQLNNALQRKAEKKQ